MTDTEAYDTNPELRHWYDKLWVANQLGYTAGTETIPRPGHYIVRPIINLLGGGQNASIGFYIKGDTIPADCFWSELFYGDHITIDYSKVNGEWQQGHTFKGLNRADDLIHFSSWTRVTHPFTLPDLFDEITTEHINIEIIGDKIIEVHLRTNPNPVGYDSLIPIWSVDQYCPAGYTRINEYTEDIQRFGFYVK